MSSAKAPEALAALPSGDDGGGPRQKAGQQLRGCRAVCAAEAACSKGAGDILCPLQQKR